MEWEHHCKEMPEEIKNIHKSELSDKSAMSFEAFKQKVVRTSFVLYGFKYCPYCGLKLGEEEE